MNYSFQNLTNVERDYLLAGLQSVAMMHLSAWKNEIQGQRSESADQFKNYYYQVSQLREKLEAILPIIEEAPKKPKIIIFKEKHSTRYFVFNNDSELHQISLKILTQRFEENCWYSPTDHNEIWERIQKALKEKDGKLAFQILDERSDYEYEKMTVKIPETYS